MIKVVNGMNIIVEKMSFKVPNVYLRLMIVYFINLKSLRILGVAFLNNLSGGRAIDYLQSL